MKFYQRLNISQIEICSPTHSGMDSPSCQDVFAAPNAQFLHFSDKFSVFIETLRQQSSIASICLNAFWEALIQKAFLLNSDLCIEFRLIS